MPDTIAVRHPAGPAGFAAARLARVRKPLDDAGVVRWVLPPVANGDWTPWDDLFPPGAPFIDEVLARPEVARGEMRTGVVKRSSERGLVQHPQFQSRKHRSPMAPPTSNRSP